ncbi:hypothetical protein HN51_027335 [Arachis hypogaea]
MMITVIIYNSKAYLSFAIFSFLLSFQVFGDELSQEKIVPTNHVVFGELEGSTSSNFGERDTPCGFLYHPSARRVRLPPSPPLPPSRPRRSRPCPKKACPPTPPPTPPRRWRRFHGPNPNKIIEKDFPFVPEPRALPPLPRPPSYP